MCQLTGSWAPGTWAWVEATERKGWVLGACLIVCLSVFSQGDKGTSWYIIWKGSVNVVTHGKVSPPFFPSPLGGNHSQVYALMGSAFGGPKAADRPGLLLPPCFSPTWACPTRAGCWTVGL